MTRAVTSIDSTRVRRESCSARRARAASFIRHASAQATITLCLVAIPPLDFGGAAVAIGL